MKNSIVKLLIFAVTNLIISTTFAQKKPNVLFIIVDDFGYHDISKNGSKVYQTPNIDNLADNAFTFQNAYASYPRCVPSRYGIMTGTYPVNEDHGDLSTIPDTKNFIKQFKAQGYHSFYVGKWHLGSEGSSPTGIGFDESFAAGDAGGTDTHFYPFNLKRVPGSKGEKAPIEDVQNYAKEGDYLSDVLTKRTIEYIKATKKGTPFIGVLAYYAVHTPIEAKKADQERNKAEISKIDFGTTPEYVKEGNAETKMRQDDADYAGMVENTDENIGKLIQELKKNGLYDNTIIVLTSDHGGLSTRGGKRKLATTNAPLRAGKGWIYEGGIKVPFMIHMPNQAKAILDTESIVLGMDIFPTLVDLALDKQIEGIDGKSLKNVINKKEVWNNRTVYWNSYKARPTQTGDHKTSAIRVGDYKLLHFVETDKVELYNVKEDVSEKNDLAASMPEKKTEMLAQLNQWKKKYNVTMKPNKKDTSELTPKQLEKKANRKASKN
ncbi:sulfatase [Flavobacterium sp. RSSA_27]|uniref:sulfatase n=1 Tax=Flavobacterium sp. RSSA_27 TaxID=3447667 RepID=UPI003F38E5E0